MYDRGAIGWLWTGLLVIGFSVAARSAGLVAVRPVAGYVCMSLNLTEQQMMDPAARVAVLESPTVSAPDIGYAAATVIASVLPPVNGFRKVLMFDGKMGWVRAAMLRPWKNPGGSQQKCIPSLMSNGRLGFGIE